MGELVVGWRKILPTTHSPSVIPKRFCRQWSISFFCLNLVIIDKYINNAWARCDFPVDNSRWWKFLKRLSEGSFPMLEGFETENYNSLQLAKQPMI
jgi:hypothetical protein